MSEYWALVYSHQLSLEGVYDYRIQSRLVQHVRTKSSEGVLTPREGGRLRVVLFQSALTRNKSWLYWEDLPQQASEVVFNIPRGAFPLSSFGVLERLLPELRNQ